MSAPYPHDYHPLAPLLRQLRGTLAWYQASQRPLPRAAFNTLAERCRDLARAQESGATRPLMRAAHWSTLPDAPLTEMRTPQIGALIGELERGERSADYERDTVSEPTPLGPLSAREFPAVTHERSPIESASFSDPPPRDSLAPGSAELMRPSVALLKHQGKLKPNAPTAPSDLSVTPQAPDHSTAQAVSPSTAWAQPLQASPSGLNATGAPPDASRDARSQLWVNQAPAPSGDTSDTSAETAPARNPKLGASLARLTQKPLRAPQSPTGESQAETNTDTRASTREKTRSVQPRLVRARGLEGDERYATLCEEIRACQRCPRGVTPHLTGEGHYGSRFMFVVGCPSEPELQIGRTLMARPERELFHQILSSMSLSRLDIYITSLLRCGATLPSAQEWSQCQEHFLGELELVRPEMIITLGYLPSAILLGDAPHQGTWGEYQGIPVMPTLHPSDILQGQESTKRTAWRHLREVMRRAELTPRSL